MIDLSKQTQTTGDHSTAVQATNVTIIQQSDRTQIEAVARDVIRRELETLTAQAGATFQTRAETLVSGFIEKLSTSSTFDFRKVEDPRFQFALHEAQKGYGKDGSAQLKDELTSLLVRIGSESRDEVAKLYAEAINVVPLLTAAQVKAIAVVCAARSLTFRPSTIEQLTDNFKSQVFPFVDGAARSSFDFNHIEYARCGQVGMGSFTLWSVVQQNYPGLFSKGFSAEAIPPTLGENVRQQLIIPCLNDPALLQVNALHINTLEERAKLLGLQKAEIESLTNLFNVNRMSEPEIIALLETRDPRFKQLADYLQTTAASRLLLTSVGVIIGVVNVENISGTTVNLSGWFSAG